MNINDFVSAGRQVVPEFLMNCCIINGSIINLAEVQSMGCTEFGLRSRLNMPLKLYRYYPNRWKKDKEEQDVNYSHIALNNKFSFPEGLTDGQKYKQFGNSVSIPVIECMAHFMLDCFKTLEKQQVEVVRALAENNPFFTKRDVMELLDLSAKQAGALLRSLVDSEELIRLSGGKATRYIKNRPDQEIPPYSQEEKVLKMARDEAEITNKLVRDVLGITNASVNVLLSGMVRKGLLLRKARGKYQLKTD